MSEQLTESHAVEAANIAAVAAEAHLKASAAATDDAVWKGLERFFNDRIAKGRFIDTGRIPFICDDLKGLHGEVKQIKDMIFWGVVSLLGSILLGLGGWAFNILVHLASK